MNDDENEFNQYEQYYHGHYQDVQEQLEIKQDQEEVEPEQDKIFFRTEEDPNFEFEMYVFILFQTT